MSTLAGIMLTPADANSGEFVEIIPALELKNSNFQTSENHIWLKNLGTDVSLTWSAFWHDGGYCLRLTRQMAEGIARAVAEQEPSSLETP